MRTTKDVMAQCIMCGKEFNVKIRIADGKIMTKCFHSYMRKHFFLGWTYSLDTKTMTAKEVNFKNLWFKIIGFTKVQRTIVYWLWGLVYGWQKHEYWECKSCC